MAAQIIEFRQQQESDFKDYYESLEIISLIRYVSKQQGFSHITKKFVDHPKIDRNKRISDNILHKYLRFLAFTEIKSRHTEYRIGEEASLAMFFVLGKLSNFFIREFSASDYKYCVLIDMKKCQIEDLTNRLLLNAMSGLPEGHIYDSIKSLSQFFKEHEQGFLNMNKFVALIKTIEFLDDFGAEYKPAIKAKKKLKKIELMVVENIEIIWGDIDAAC